jgi:DNA repair exonuclease SbcCD ATPase subunit
MIPHRVSMKNFLCYADQEFRFEAHRVWLLHGPNSVGKSAVFDAMVSALYGVSRRSDARNNAVADVVRHGESSMRVELDFEISAERYRIWRTRDRRGQPKQGVFHWSNDRWSAVRDVNKGSELSEWVERTLDLTYDAFVSAVLLRQGSAGKLIDADKDTRRELFGSFIDLDPYMRLHDRVTAARSELAAEVRQLRAWLNGMPVVGDEQLAEAVAAEQAAGHGLKEARAAENAARDRLGHARNWEQNEETRRRIQGELDAAADRARHAAELEQQVGRLRELRVLVPALTRAGELQHDRATAEDRLRQRSGEQATAIAHHEELVTALQRTRAEIDRCREQIGDLERQILTGQADEQRLSKEIKRAEQALHTRLALLKGESFDPDLDDRIRDAERATTEAQLAKDALPYLDAMARHRAEYRRALGEELAATEDVTAASVDVEQLRRREAAAAAESSEAARSRGEAEQALAVAADQRQAAIGFRDRFAEATAKPVCSECRQPIDARHVAKERDKLERRIHEADASLERRRDQVATAVTEADAAQNRHRRLESEWRAAEQWCGDAIRARDDARRRAAEAQAAFDRARNTLGDPFADRVPALAADGFPTSDDLVEIRTTAHDLAARACRRDGRLQRRRDRERTRSEIQLLEQSIDAIGAPADVTAARTERARVEAELAGLRDGRRAAEELGAEAARAERRLQAEQHHWACRLTQLAVEVARAETEVEFIRRQLTEAIAEIPESYWAAAATAAGDELQALASELSLLEDGRVEEQFEALGQDRTREADRERQLADVHQQIARLPEEARRPVAEVEHEVSTAEAATRKAEAGHDEARNRMRTLSGHRDQRRETEGRLDQVEREYKLHERLADLLGPEGIQLDLVRGAEGRILARANEILMRLSSGELRFEPPDPESSRPFDLAVRRIGCPAPIGAGNLSGGQRFRVAIALALAVGGFAHVERRPLESLIIDEGFGDLDREGRMVMIAELRDGPTLSQMFKRVLVVSHQEDFAAALPVGYRFWSEGGMTKVEPFGPCSGER